MGNDPDQYKPGRRPVPFQLNVGKMESGFVVLFTLALAGVTNGKCRQDWDALSVKWPDRTTLPVTVEDARQQGWVRKDRRSYRGSFFVGERWVLPEENRPYVLFGQDGRLVGIQTALPKTIEAPKRYVDMFNEEKGEYHLTAYFTQPWKIWHHKFGRKRHSNCNSLYIQVGGNQKHLIKVPVKERGLDGTRWVIGRCFNGMGSHYWYNVNTEMKYEDFFPVFLLYNNGYLNGFGWAVKGDTPGDMSFEHPQPLAIKLFFNAATEPKFMAKLKSRTTQHIFMQSGVQNYNSCFREN